jgi:large subunit ribosomal protein L9
MLAEAKSLAEKIQGATIEVSAKVGDSGKIFGSINTVVLAEALKKGGYNVERKTLQILDDGIKTIGTYKAVAQLHKEVKVEFNFNVVAE